MDVPVLVWSCPLDVPDAAWRELVACLPSGERGEGERRSDPLDRRRWLAARAWRRHLLAAELGCEPGKVPIVVDGRGKPRLGGSRFAELRFSASRSQGLTCVALSRRMEVGVDVEARHPALDIERFAARFLSPGEQRALARRPSEHRAAALVECWTRKEAYLKGTGEGLSVSPAAVEAWAGDDRRVVVGDWSIHSLTAAPGFAAAVAGKSPLEWTPSAADKESVATFSGFWSKG